ncbi:MAG: cupin domain-containing protein [Chloroflexota bacterium]
MPEHVLAGTVVRRNDIAAVDAPFGSLRWMANQKVVPGIEQTFGVVTIKPGQHNPLHYHPNCEELLYVLSGECDHRLNNQVVHMASGDLIHVPRGVHHNATCTTAEPLQIVVSFSSPDRQTVNLEDSSALG